MARAVIGTNVLGKVLLAATKVTAVSIVSFKNEGVQELYEAYRDGADGIYGLHARAGDFEALLSQSPGVLRQVRIDAVGEYCRVHDIEESTLSSRKLEDIKNLAIERLKHSFASRRAEEAEIAKNQQFYERLLQTFETCELDSAAMRRDSFSELTYEQRLHRFEAISQSILGLTGKTVNFGGDSYGKFISEYDLADAMRKWFSSKQEAMDFLRGKGLMPEEASMKPVAMTASGTIRYGALPKEVLRVAVRFMNVGTQVPGQGAVTGSATDATDGEVYGIQGTFTGGPSGTMTVTADGDTYHAQVSGGRTIVVPKMGTLTIQNPSAFDGFK